MADTKISGLPAASALTATDAFAVVQGGASKKATGAQIAALAQTTPAALGQPSHAGITTSTFTTLTTFTGLELIAGVTQTAGVFTIPTNGRYSVVFNCGFSGNATGARVARVAKNGALWGQDRRLSLGGGGTRTICSFVQDGRFVAGDTLEFVGWQDSGGNLAVEVDYSSASLRYVGP